ncbi:MAG TPA: histidine phosphatase family protein [Candidatus Nanoarchaeia archaeon]|nr:histidine phosphatase family protein [Candidatus Nanoarchaeia archaeon]
MRHGITPLNQQKRVNGEVDEPLAPEGIEQAKEAVLQIPKSVNVVYSSPLLRAKQTAQIFGMALNLPVVFAQELTEVKMGSLAGKSWEEMENGQELKVKHRAFKFDYRPYGGESVEDVKKRVLGFLKKINTAYEDNQVLIITHGGIIRFFYLHQHGQIPYETEKHISPLSFDLNKILRSSQG